MVVRIPSGIPGLDPLIQGGFIKNSVNLITGTTGTGKTLFCCQFLWHGLRNNENCMFITLEEKTGDIKSDALQFGWNFDRYEKKGKFIIRHTPPFKADDLFFLENEIRKYKISRVAIDSISVITMSSENLIQARKDLYKLVDSLKTTGATIILTSEILEDSKALSRLGLVEFIVDSVLVTHFVGIGGEEFGNIQIRKMRKTKHATAWYPLNITNRGIVVRGEERVLMK